MSILGMIKSMGIKSMISKDSVKEMASDYVPAIIDSIKSYTAENYPLKEKEGETEIGYIIRFEKDAAGNDTAMAYPTAFDKNMQPKRALGKFDLRKMGIEYDYMTLIDKHM